ncbi:MAG: hypothetical protein U5K84_13075 [Alkalibacterium sp.]|nr:hypothetical protein [Alkalibacterium sp.]
MSYLLFILGFGLTACTIIDLVWTTLWVDGGAGPLSRRVARYTWKGIEGLTRKNNNVLTLVGPVILVVTTAQLDLFHVGGADDPLFS